MAVGSAVQIELVLGGLYVNSVMFHISAAPTSLDVTK